MPVEDLKFRVIAKTDKATKNMDGFNKKLKSTVASVATLTGGMLALKSEIKFLSNATKMAMEQEEIFKKLSISVELAGKSYKNVEGRLSDMFSVLQKTTRYGDTDTAAALQKMITFSGDFEKSLEMLPTTLDMASSGLFDISTASRYMGMAISGNVEMLGRYISELRPTNNEMLKTMTQSEKTAYAMDLLKKKFQDFAEKDLQTAAGKLEQVNNYMSDLQEQIGDAITPAITKLSGTFLNLTKNVMEFLNLADFSTKNYAEFRAEIEQLSISELEARKQANLEARIAQGNLIRELSNREKLNEVGKQELQKAQEKVQTLSDQNKIINEVLNSKREDIELERQKTEELEKQMKLIAEKRGLEREFKLEINDEYEKIEVGEGAFDMYFEELERAERVSNFAANTISSMFVTAFDTGFDNIGKMFQNLIKKMLADLVASGIMNFLTGGLSTGVGFFRNIFSTGGNIKNIGGTPIKAQAGLDFTVPRGFPNDSFPIMVQSGEHVSVTPTSGGNINMKNVVDEIIKLRNEVKNKPIANTIIFDNIDMSKYVEKGDNLRRSL